MGMFDYVVSSYDLGEPFTNNVCQTKSIDRHLDGTLSTYWIDPVGYLWSINYDHTADFVEYKPGDIKYNAERSFLNFGWVPNGKHGRVHVYPITDYVTIYPEKWERTHDKWPDCRIHFVNGKIQSYETL